MKRLQRVQNTAARLLTNTRKYDHITPALKQLHWLPIKARVEYKFLVLTYKAIEGTAPVYLAGLVEVFIPLRCDLRSSNDRFLLDVPFTALKSGGDRAFCKAAPVLWNRLPLELRMCETLKLFKGKLKTHLFRRYFDC